jgi:hypothetical protein
MMVQGKEKKGVLCHKVHKDCKPADLELAAFRAYAKGHEG